MNLEKQRRQTGREKNGGEERVNREINKPKRSKEFNPVNDWYFDPIRMKIKIAYGMA